MFRMQKKPEPEGLLFSNAMLKTLLIPLIIEQAFGILVGAVDGMMVAHVGEAALSGVSLVDMLTIMILNLFAALTTGGAVVASQYLGAGKQNRACQAAGQLLLVTLAVSVSVMILALIFKAQALKLFFGSIEPEVMENALVYFTISAVSYPFIALWSAANALFRTMGNSKITMKTSVLVNVLNFIGNAILIYGFQMGVAGAALATLFARIVACLLSLFLLTNSNAVIYISRHQSWRPDWKMIKNILRIGIPSGLENTFFQLGRVLVLGIITMYGTTQIAANSVANTLSSFPPVPASAVGLAMITVVGQCVGAGDLKQAVYYTKKLMKLAYGTFFAISAVLTVLLPFFLKAYNLSEESARLAFLLVMLHTVFGTLLWPASFTMPNALRAANDVTFTMTVSVVSMIVFRIIGSYVLGLWMGYGALGVWVSMIIDWVCRVSCFLWRLLRGGWKKKALTKLD